MVGNTLGAYRIVRKLGEGGMGAVYLGEHSRLDRRVAIKVLRTELSSDQSILDRFFTEARATSLIHHPNIVEVFDCDIDATGRAYIMMEFLEGESLAALLERQGHLAGDLGSAMAIAIQATGALAAAHAKGIIHRDLKPENMVVTAEGDGKLRTKIVDFGIAKLIGDAGMAALHQTRTGSLMGTPLYMAPEQARGASKVDARTDIYSFGCIIFAMLTGTPPFVREGVGDLMIAHMTEPAPDLDTLVPGLPPRLTALVRACLEKDPVQRPQEMRAVENELREIARAVPAAHLVPVAAPPRAEAGPPTPSAPPASIAVPTAEMRGTRGARGAQADPRTVTTLESGAGQVGTTAAVRASGARRWVKIAVPASVAVVAAALFGLNRSGREADGSHAPTVTPAAASHLAPPPAPRPEEKMATIQLRGLPLGAVVMLDDQPADLPLKLPRDGRTYAVLARAPGYADTRITVRATSDQQVTVVMSPSPAAAAETAPAAKRGPQDKKDKRDKGGKHGSKEFRGFNDL